MTTRRRFIRGIGGLLVPAALARKADAGVLMMSGSRGVPTGGAGGGDTALSMAVNALASGAWGSFTTSNRPDGDPANLGFNSSIYPYSHRLIWNPIQKQLTHYGGAHDEIQPPNTSAQFHGVSIYTEATNSWTSEAVPFSFVGGAHGYDEADHDTATGDLYLLTVSNATLRKRTPAGTYSALSAIPNIYNFDRALVYHPGLYSGAGGLVSFDARYIHSYRISNDTWTQLGTSAGFVSGNGYPFSGCYVPAHGVAYFGGSGDTTIYKVAADGSFTTITSPVPIYNGQPSDGLDQCTFLRAGNSKLYVLDIGHGNYYTSNGSSFSGAGALDSGFLSQMASSKDLNCCMVPAHDAQLYDAMVWFYLTSQSQIDLSDTAYVWRLP